MRFRQRTFAYSILTVKAYFNFLKHRGSQSWNLNTVNSWHLILSRCGGHYYNLCESTHISLFNEENSVLKRSHSGQVWLFLVKPHSRSFEKKWLEKKIQQNKLMFTMPDHLKVSIVSSHSQFSLLLRPALPTKCLLSVTWLMYPFSAAAVMERKGDKNKSLLENKTI